MALRVLSVVTVLALLGGCAGLATRMERPTLSVAGIQLSAISLFEQSYRVQLRIRNPNPFDVPIEALRYDLTLNGSPFASGLSHEQVVVPAFGSERVEVEAVSSLSGLVRQLDTLGTEPSLDYRLRGKIYLADGSAVPFDYRGDVASPR